MANLYVFFFHFSHSFSINLDDINSTTSCAQWSRIKGKRKVMYNTNKTETNLKIIYGYLLNYTNEQKYTMKWRVWWWWSLWITENCIDWPQKWTTVVVPVNGNEESKQKIMRKNQKERDTEAQRESESFADNRDQKLTTFLSFRMNGIACKRDSLRCALKTEN